MDFNGFAIALYQLCLATHATCTLWFADRTWTQIAGDEQEELHTYGLAADLTFPTDDDREAGVRSATKLGLIVRRGRYSIHVEAPRPYLKPAPQEATL